MSLVIRSLLPVAIAAALAGVVGCGRAETDRSQVDQATVSVTESPSQKTDRQFQVTLNTTGPLKMTAAPLDVTVRENGQPAGDLEVSVEFRMPPAGAMGEMRTGSHLEPAGEGRYRGTVDMTMAGQWDAIVRVRRNGEVVAVHTQPVTAE